MLKIYYQNLTKNLTTNYLLGSFSVLVMCCCKLLTRNVVSYTSRNKGTRLVQAHLMSKRVEKSLQLSCDRVIEAINVSVDDRCCLKDLTTCRTIFNGGVVRRLRN